MNREQFAIVFRLLEKAPWLTDKSEALMSLLFDDCSNDVSRELLIDLINRFHYISNEAYQAELKKLAESIVQDERISADTTQVIAMAADEGSDSSQFILYGLKMAFHKLRWVGYGEVNRFGRALRKYRDNNKYRNLVLVDEFIGSGQTVISRVAELRRLFNQANIPDYRIIVRVLVASSVGLEVIQNAGIEVHANHIIQRGITDYYPPEAITSKIELMKQLENLLAPIVDQTTLPSLGYGSCESLYIREEGNTPNCVFPVFWWPQYQNGVQRKLLMERAML